VPNSDGGGDPRVYDNLWNNIIRWLIKDPELDLVRVHPSNGVRPLGESVDIEIRLFEPDYRPAKRQDLRAEIRRRQDAADRSSGEVVHSPTDLATDDHGRHQLTWEAKRPGIYDVSVRTIVAGRQLTGRTVFVVSDERPEMRRVIDTDKLMESIALATKGRGWSLDERNPDLVLNPPRVSDVTSPRYHERSCLTRSLCAPDSGSAECLVCAPPDGLARVDTINTIERCDRIAGRGLLRQRRGSGGRGQPGR
jgi:hypothetical protein